MIFVIVTWLTIGFFSGYAYESYRVHTVIEIPLIEPEG